ncbi:hypothetical protein ACVW1A_006548 [Bradyrhizobium sp. LB1.3]
MAFLNINATLPEKGRDLRLDLFRGIANWAIFLDHIPDNVVNWITTRNYGFSDAADLFVFISGYTASFVYARMMLERGFLVGATRLTKRVWQLYVAHIILFVIYIASISYLALRFGDSEMINEFNVAGLVDNATETLRQGLFLRFKPLNLDVLPLYIVLMGLFPPVLWFMLRKPDLTMVLSIALWLTARHFGLNLNAYPAGQWYFNPYCWQVLFVFGAWCAMGGARRSMTLINAPITLWLCLGYMLFALVMTMAGRFPTLAGMFPEWLFSAFNPNDKTNLAPYRFIHFVVIVILVDPLRAEGLAGPGMERVRSDHRLRPAIARRVLRRRVPVLRRPFRAVDELGLAVRADLRQRRRHRDHDDGGLLHLVVEEAGQAAEAAAAQAGSRGGKGYLKGRQRYRAGQQQCRSGRGFAVELGESLVDPVAAVMAAPDPAVNELPVDRAARHEHGPEVPDLRPARLRTRRFGGCDRKT